MLLETCARLGDLTGASDRRRRRRQRPADDGGRRPVDRVSRQAEGARQAAMSIDDGGLDRLLEILR